MRGCAVNRVRYLVTWLTLIYVVSDECAVQDFACTLLVAVVDQHRATFWQIGDGAICFRFPRNRSGKEEGFRVGYVVGWVCGVIIATIRAGIANADLV